MASRSSSSSLGSLKVRVTVMLGSGAVVIGSRGRTVDDRRGEGLTEMEPMVVERQVYDVPGVRYAAEHGSGRTPQVQVLAVARLLAPEVLEESQQHLGVQGRVGDLALAHGGAGISRPRTHHLEAVAARELCAA